MSTEPTVLGAWGVFGAAVAMCVVETNGDIQDPSSEAPSTR